MSINIKISSFRKLRDTNKIAKVIVVNKCGEVLLLLRKEDQRYPKKWDLPGGHLVEGEEWEDGAARETKEETNLNILSLEFLYDDGKKRYFKTTHWEGELFEKDELPEHDDYRWSNFEEIKKLNNIGEIYLDAIRKAIG